MHSCVLARLKPSRGKDEGQLGLKSGFIGPPGGGMAQSIKDTQNAAYKLIYGVVRHPEPLQSTALIETCAEMCRTEGVNFAEVLIEVLQDSPSEGHGAPYWIITNDRIRYRHELLSAILKHSGPLSSKTIDEVDEACTISNDRRMFGHLWRHPAYHGLSGTDELSLCGTSPADYIQVENPPSDSLSHDAQYSAHWAWLHSRRWPWTPRRSTFFISNGGLVVHFEITQFHKRMSTSGRIVLKFMADGLSPC